MTDLSAETSKPSKLKSFLKDEANLYVIKVGLVYAAWKVLHTYFLHGHGAINQWWTGICWNLGIFYATITSFVLNLLAQGTSHYGYTILYVQSGKTIRVEEHCLAIPATIIFISSILLFRGRLKDKLWFIPMGVLGICLINLFRLVVLSVIFEHFNREFYNINHSFVYVVITYVLILILIVWWMRKFAPRAIA